MVCKSESESIKWYATPKVRVSSGMRLQRSEYQVVCDCKGHVTSKVRVSNAYVTAEGRVSRFMRLQRSEYQVVCDYKGQGTKWYVTSKVRASSGM